MITQKQLKDVLHYDPITGVFTWIMKPNRRIKIGDTAGGWHGNGYLKIVIGGHQYLAHRLAWFYAHGEWPKQIDHINHVRHDNRLCNLRAVDRATNQKNVSMYKSNTSGTLGVNWHKARSKWMARICTDGRCQYLGIFQDKDAAIAARKRAEAQYGFHPNHGAT